MTPCRCVNIYRHFGRFALFIFRIPLVQEQEHSYENFKFDDAVSYKVINEGQNTWLHMDTGRVVRRKKPSPILGDFNLTTNCIFCLELPSCGLLPRKLPRRAQLSSISGRKAEIMHIVLYIRPGGEVFPQRRWLVNWDLNFQ